MRIGIEAIRWAAVPLVVTAQAAALLPLLAGGVALAVVGRGLAGVAQVVAWSSMMTGGAVSALLAGADRVNQIAGRVVGGGSACAAGAGDDDGGVRRMIHAKAAAEIAKSNRAAARSAYAEAIRAVEAMPQDEGPARPDCARRRGPVPVEVTRAAVLAGEAVSFAASKAAVKAERRRREHLRGLGYVFLSGRRGDDEGGGL